MSDSDAARVVTLVNGAADWAFLEAQRTGGTGARCVNAALLAAFECALANGLIEVTSPDDWPRWVVTSPPYRLTEDVT